MMNNITLRDHFAGLAMQSLYLSAVEWETTGKERHETVGRKYYE